MFAGIADLTEHDRHVARHRMAPEPGLPAAVLREQAGLGAQRGVGIEDRAGQTRVELDIGLAGIELAQHHLAVGPGQVEDAIGQALVLVLLDQSQAISRLSPMPVTRSRVAV
jgi:hypothetical protein